MLNFDFFQKSSNLGLQSFAKNTKKIAWVKHLQNVQSQTALQLPPTIADFKT